MKGLLIRKNNGLFDVELDGEITAYKALGKVKKSGIYVGDYVEVDKVITKVYPRKNRLIRPPLANLDKLFIVLASVPKPDFVLVDKLILYCKVSGIEPIIIVNKDDINEKSFDDCVKKIYNKVVKVIFASKDNVLEIRKQIVGITAFAGQSAVGKSSLINSLLGLEQAKVGNLSQRIERGKQTTRMTSLYRCEKGYIADTAGFSLLDANLVLPVQPQELGRYYPDFLKFIPECKFRSCTHEGDKNCGVVCAVKDGKIDNTRYNNYLKILMELKEKK